MRIRIRCRDNVTTQVDRLKAFRLKVLNGLIRALRDNL